MSSERGSAARREELVRAAATLFAEQGYEGTAVSDIVARAGVAQGTFYLYFHSKEEALRAVADELIERVARTALEASQAIDSPLERILTAARAAFEAFTEERQLLLAAVHAGGTAAHDRAMVLDILPKIEAPLRGWIEEAIARGEIPADIEPKFLAAFIVAAGTRILMGSLLFGYPGGLDEVMSRLLVLMRRALGAV